MVNSWSKWASLPGGHLRSNFRCDLCPDDRNEFAAERTYGTRVRFKRRTHKPRPRRDLEQYIDSKGSLISDGWMVAVLNRPTLNDNPGKILQHECTADVKNIQRSIRASCEIFGEQFGNRRIAEDRPASDHCHYAPQN